MRTIYRQLILSLALLVPFPVLAGGIGFVDAERAVTTVDEGKAKLRELEAWAGPEREKLERLGTRVNEIRQQIASQGSVASPDAVQRMRDDELAARRAFEDAKRDFDRRLEKKQNELLGDVATKVGTVASDYAKANGLDAIFVLGAQPLVYVAESADLTDEVVRLYNERFPVASAQ